MCLRGRHREKQKRPKVANLQLHPSSILKHRSFTQCQHARCSFYNIRRENMLVWPLYPVSFLSGGRSNKGAMWCRHQTRDFGNAYSMNCKEMPPPPTSNALIIHTWSQQRQVSAMEVTHGPRNSIRINFGVGGVMGVVLTLGNILRRRNASTPRYRPSIPFSDVQEGI